MTQLTEQLSEHFTLAELCYSETAEANGLDNTPNAEETENLRALVLTVLEPVRRWFGVPVVVTSGFRCPKVNRLVGGASTSHHLTGCAADIRFNLSEKKYNVADIFSYIYKYLSFTELIAEGIPDNNWVHVAYDPTVRTSRVKYMLSSEGVVYTSSYEKIMNWYKQYGIVPRG